MEDKYLKELIQIFKTNTFYTGAGALVGVVALVIALVALFR